MNCANMVGSTLAVAAGLLSSAVCAQAVKPIAPASGVPAETSKVDRATAPGQTDRSAPPAGTVSEVIVTAQRRAENVQSVPISITAVSGNNLVKSGVSTLDGLQRLAPGVTLSTVGSGFVSYTYIRGGGTNQADPGSDPSVAFFVDEIYIGGTAGLQFDLFDIDHVEVLKGPQGTLFGRNASSGAISVVTKRPSASFEGDLDVEVGNYDAFLTRGGVSGPLTSDGKLRFRVSGSYRERDGYVTNLTGGENPGGIDSGGGRGQLEYVGDKFKVLLTADFLRARNGQTDQFLTGPTLASFVDPTLPQPSQSFFKHYYDYIGSENQDLHDINGRVELNTPVGTVTSISAYRWNRFARNQDNDDTLYNSYVLSSVERDETFSQELRLTGDAINRLHYVGGLFYYHANIRDSFTAQLGPAFPIAVVRGHSANDASTIKTDSYAAFGQLTFDITPKLSITGGGRYTEDDKADQRQVRGFLAAAPFVVTPSATFDNFSPTATISYKPGARVLTYFSYREGFKSGGFQGLFPPTAAIANTPFLPEKVTSYEAGVKSTLLDRRLLLNVALFRSDITDQQVSRALSGTTQVIDNAGQTRDDGIDVQLTAKPTAFLTFSADLTAQKARFEQYQNGAISYAGNHQLRSPDFAGFFSAEYVRPIGNLGDLALRGEYSYRTKTFFDPSNLTQSGLYQPAYGIGSLRLTYTPAGRPIDISLFVRNVGDVHYYQNLAIAGLTANAVPGEPRTFGAAVNLHFR